MKFPALAHITNARFDASVLPLVFPDHSALLEILASKIVHLSKTLKVKSPQRYLVVGYSFTIARLLIDKLPQNQFVFVNHESEDLERLVLDLDARNCRVVMQAPLAFASGNTNYVSSEKFDGIVSIFPFQSMHFEERRLLLQRLATWANAKSFFTVMDIITPNDLRAHFELQSESLERLFTNQAMDHQLAADQWIEELLRPSSPAFRESEFQKNVLDAGYSEAELLKRSGLEALMWCVKN